MPTGRMKPALEETQSNQEDFLGHRVCLVLFGPGQPGGIWIRTDIPQLLNRIAKSLRLLPKGL